jgi:L-alanine-DL-glutamate epimerase-like enolase superfamily enzyme
MEVTDVETHLVPSDAALSGYGLNGYLVVRVHTDAGHVGVGEAGTPAAGLVEYPYRTRLGADGSVVDQ